MKERAEWRQGTLGKAVTNIRHVDHVNLRAELCWECADTKTQGGLAKHRNRHQHAPRDVSCTLYEFLKEGHPIDALTKHVAVGVKWKEQSRVLNLYDLLDGDAVRSSHGDDVIVPKATPNSLKK